MQSGREVMIYQFRINSQESKQFQLEIELDGRNTFFDLHNTIQASLRFQSFQLASFFVPDSTGRKQVEISLLDFGVNGKPFFIMQKTRIDEFISAENPYLIYTFDLFNDRSLFVELTGINMENNLKEPFVKLNRGEAPVQVLEETVAEQDLSLRGEEEAVYDYGILEDYYEIFGEMEDF